MSKNHFSHANDLYHGGGFFAPMQAENERLGAPVMLPTKYSIGAALAADADYIIDAATSTELPDTETVTYTTADDGVSPLDNADTPTVTSIVTSTGATASVWPMDVPRNLVSVVTHGSSVVAMSIVITGYDVWKQKMVETHTITATGTTKTVNGAKAFAYVESIAITAAADAEANTLNLGSGDVFGLPYALQAVGDLISLSADGVQESAAAVTAADATTATASTGDVRGTLDPTTAADGSVVFDVWYYVATKDTEVGLRGIDQYEG